MIKLVVKSLAIASITLVALLLWYSPTVLNTIRRNSVHESPSIPALDQIQALSELTTLRADLSDVRELTINGKTGSLTAVLIIHGTATLGVDLTKARLTIDVERRHAVLGLPSPAVQTVALDHDRTRIATLRASGLWIIVPCGNDADAVVIGHCYRRGQQVVSNSARSLELVEAAKRQTQSLMNDFFKSMDWVVECRWD